MVKCLKHSNQLSLDHCLKNYTRTTYENFRQVSNLTYLSKTIEIPDHVAKLLISHQDANKLEQSSSQYTINTTTWRHPFRRFRMTFSRLWTTKKGSSDHPPAFGVPKVQSLLLSFSRSTLLLLLTLQGNMDWNLLSYHDRQYYICSSLLYL